MLNFFSKRSLLGLLAFLSFNAMQSSVAADECCDSEYRFYVGGFGGGIYSNPTKLSQMGTAFFPEAVGGPLAVFARGHTKKRSTGFGGVQIGYECPMNMGCLDWKLASALEVEAYFFSLKRKGHFSNDTDRVRLPEHDFVNSFNSDTSVILVNAVFALDNPCFCGFSPYIGGGIGATHISLRNGKSLQVDPPEPGINHFNSKRNDSSWAFAAQAKAGLRYKISNSLHIFGEYRFLFVDSSNYIFGSTVYKTHAPTSPWNVKLKNSYYNAFAIGIQYDL